jgi:hypothetical protein
MNRTRSLLALVLLAAVAAGCAKREAAPPAAAATPPPAGTPLAKVREGMSMREVEDVAGVPTDRRHHITGKQFIPWYFGNDTNRMNWHYQGQGRVVFQTGAWREFRVMRVEYDPSEPGRPR